MIKISSKRVKGSGKGAEIKFPTINFILAKLPSGLEQGLYATVGGLGKGISLISIDKGQYRIETHIIKGYKYNNEINIKVGTRYTLNFLGKLRDPKRTRDIKKLIADDIELASEYFKNFKTCLSCQLCYIQDYGYSNYTVNGSNIGCYANIFDEVDYNGYYNYCEQKYNSYDCNHMVPGEHWEFDVDGESEKPSEDWIISTVRDVRLNKILDKKK